MTPERSIPRHAPTASADSVSANPHPCPVRDLALTTRRLWVLHDDLDRVVSAASKARSTGWEEETQRVLLEQMDTTSNFATFAQAQSLEGALFQVALIADAISTMVERLPVREQSAREVQLAKRKIERLAASAIRSIAPHCDARVVEIAATYSSGGDALMPEEAAAKVIADANPVGGSHAA